MSISPRCVPLALAFCLAATTAMTAAAQQPQLSLDPDRAFRRALLFPGGGHFYAGESVKGAALLGVAAGGLLAGALLSDGGGEGDRECYNEGRHDFSNCRGRTPLMVGAAVAAGSWIYGIVDARPSAERARRRLGLHPGGVDARVGIVPARSDGGVALGLVLTW